ncbi:MAG TPA: GGDEF domain-containing protein [Rectinemataceae bacterium]|nr:GGDEF domain-containing protein [Rectinemataceae bacterium]
MRLANFFGAYGSRRRVNILMIGSFASLLALALSTAEMTFFEHGFVPMVIFSFASTMAFVVLWYHRLRSQSRHLRLIIDTVPVFIFAKDDKGRYLLANKMMAERMGASSEEMIGTTDLDYGLPREEMEGYLAIDRAVLESGTTIEVPEYSLARKDGTLGWFQTIKVPYRLPGSNRKAILGVTLDITELKLAQLRIEESERRFKHLAHHDHLTDLPNRALFADRLEQALALARRESRRLALAFIDLDGFKEINDSLGHETGDLLLKEAADRMRECIRASDGIGRIGGDEFVVFLRGVENAEVALSALEKLQAAMERPFIIVDNKIRISASIGVSIFPDHAEEERSLSRKADKAMYRAKAEGRNRVCLFDTKSDGE